MTAWIVNNDYDYISTSNYISVTTSFTEHGIILGLVSINADLTYQQGIPKMDLRSTRYDFYDPVLVS